MATALYCQLHKTLIGTDVQLLLALFSVTKGIRPDKASADYCPLGFFTHIMFKVTQLHIPTWIQLKCMHLLGMLRAFVRSGHAGKYHKGLNRSHDENLKEKLSGYLVPSSGASDKPAWNLTLLPGGTIQLWPGHIKTPTLTLPAETWDPKDSQGFKGKTPVLCRNKI